MFQTFPPPADPTLAAERLKRVRTLMAAAKVDAFLVPRADEHQGEYVAPASERLKWLTGFSGSAGLAAIAAKRAALFTDGRYTVQARTECDPAQFDFPGLARTELAPWLKKALKRGATVGFDPWLHTVSEIERLTADLAPAAISLKPLPANLVDRAWGGQRPAPPATPIRVHPDDFAGRSSASKIADVQKRLKDAGHDAVVLTMPDSIAWLFNIRGADVPHNPVTLAFALVPQSGKPELFVDTGKVTREARAHLAPVAKVSSPEALKARLAALRKAGKRVALDPDRAAWSLARALGPKSAAHAADPCLALKAIKNPTEIDGSRSAHLRDGGSLVRFLAWIDRTAPDGGLDEIAVVRRLEELRATTQLLEEISFDTISGSGPNGAIVHYRVTEGSNRAIRDGDLLLIDSGAQYRDGTTDVTRTVAIGRPSAEMRTRFTAVLKGHIAIATARFPEGTRGVDLDPFARRALWDLGLDYDHGTGHGVGSYLSVHEGPQSISRAGMVPLKPGMICSNEPGYYREGAYGIRIENLVLVTPAEVPPGGERPMMGFETLTLAPIDRTLIDKSLLTPAEIDWIDAYHDRVRTALTRDLDPETRGWLDAATAPL